MAKAPPVVRELRGVLYALLTVLAGLFISAVAFVTYPLVKPFDPETSLAHANTTRLARWIIALFGVRPIVRGREHLVRGRGAIIVSNHQSDLDSNLLSYAAHDVNFKCVFKWELWLFPGIGSCMYMCGYMSVNRGNRESAHAMMAQAYLQRNVWVLFFPEGTRKIDGRSGRMGAFKRGAFELALRTRAPLQPMTVSGSRDLMSAFGTLPALHFADPGSPTVTIHAPIYPLPEDTVESLMARTREVIGSALRSCDDVPVQAPARLAAAAAPASATAAVAEASSTDTRGSEEGVKQS